MIGGQIETAVGHRVAGDSPAWMRRVLRPILRRHDHRASAVDGHVVVQQAEWVGDEPRREIVVSGEDLSAPDGVLGVLGVPVGVEDDVRHRLAVGAVFREVPAVVLGRDVPGAVRHLRTASPAAWLLAILW